MQMIELHAMENSPRLSVAPRLRKSGGGVGNGDKQWRIAEMRQYKNRFIK